MGAVDSAPLRRSARYLHIALSRSLMHTFCNARAPLCGPRQTYERVLYDVLAAFATWRLALPAAGSAVTGQSEHSCWEHVM